MGIDEKSDGLLSRFRKDPSDTDAFRELSEHLFFEGHWKEYVDVCVQRAESFDDSMEGARLFAKAASITEDKLRDLGRAESLYRSSLGLEKEFRPAMLGLRQVLERGGRWDALVEIVLDEARLASPLERPLLYMQAGKILESKVGDVPRAIDTYKRILGMQPGHTKALEALEKNFRALGRWEDLREMFENVVSAGATSNLQSKVLFKLGKLYETRFSDLLRATRCLEMVRDMKPEVASVYKDLEQLYRAQKNWRALVNVLDAEAKLDLSADERARCLKTAGDILVEELDDMGEASRFFSRAAELAPDLEPDGSGEAEPASPEEKKDAERERLDACVEEASDPDEKARRLLDLAAHLFGSDPGSGEGREAIEKAAAMQPISRATWNAVLESAHEAGVGAGIAALLEARADETEDAEAAAGLFIELGDFILDRLGDRARGIRAYQKALKKHPHDEEAVSRLETHWESMGHDEGLVSLYRWQAAQGRDESVRKTATRKLTRVLSRDPKKALEASKLLESAVLENPADEDAVGDYVELMLKEGRADSVRDTLQKALESAPGAVPARFHLARLLIEVDELRDASDLLEDLHREDPEDPRFFEALVEALDASHDYDRKGALLVERIRRMENFEERLAGFLELGALYRDQVRALDEAVGAFEDALAIDPANEQALDALERVYEDSERWGELVEVLERRAAFVMGEEGASDIYMRAGEIWSAKAGDLSAAATAFEKAAALDPENLEPLRRLEETYTGLKDSAGLLRVLLKLREATQDPDEAVRCLAKAGDVTLADLGDAERAQVHFREVLDVRPDHVPALHGLQRVYEALGDARGRGEALLQEAAVTENAAVRARLYREGGLVLLEPDPDAAEKALREALALEPENLEAAEALEKVYETRKEWGRYVDMAWIRLERLEPGPDHDRLSLRVAEVLEELGRAEEALALYTAVLKASPDAGQALAGVRRIAEETQSFGAAIEALRREIEIAPETEAAPLYEKLGSLLETRMNDFPGALEAFRRACELRPGSPSPTEDVERLRIKTGSEEELVELLVSGSSSMEGEAKCHPLLRAGDLALRRLFDSDRALELLRGAHAADPGNAAARNALKSLLTRKRRWDELVPVIESELVLKSEEERLGLLLELGLLQERYTEDFDQAVERFEAVLARDPLNQMARRALARVMKRKGDHRALADNLSMEFDQTGDDRTAASIAIEVAGIFEGPLSNPEQAAAWYEKALARVADHATALGALERLYESLGKTSDLVRVEEAVLRTDASDARKKAVSVRLGRLYEEEFHKLDLALKCYKSALSFDPNSLGALRGIQRVARAAKNFEACRKAFEREIRMGGEPSRLALLHQGVGIILNNEGKHEKALEHFEEASRYAPGNREVLRDLIQLYEKEEKSEELADALERWADLAPTGVERAETLLTAARVSDDALKDASRAIRTLQRANEADGKNTEVLSFLGNLYFARGNYQAVVELLHQEIGLAADREKKSRLLLRAARIYEDPLGDMYKSAECLQEAVRLNPQGGKGLKALRDLQKRFGPKAAPDKAGGAPVAELLAEAHRIQDKDADRASALYMNVLDADPANGQALEGMVKLSLESGKIRQAAVWLSMVAGVMAEGPGAEGKDDKPSVFFRLGKLIEEHLEDTARAVEAYFRAWELAPALTDASEAVRRLAPQARMWEEYVKVRAVEARDADREEKLAIYIELATIEEEDLRNAERAAGWVRMAMEEAPTDLAVLNAAVRVFEKTGDLRALAESLGKAHDVARIQGTAVTEEAAEVARIYFFKLHDPERTASWFVKALEDVPGDQSLLSECRQACIQAGRVREADRLFLREIEATSDREAKARLHVERAGFLIRDLGDEGEALRSFREAAQILPKDFEILSQVESLAKRTGRWEELAEVLAQMADLSEVESEKADLWTQAGDIYWERVSDFPQARRSYAKALKLNPGLEKAKLRLIGIPEPE